MQSTRRVRGYAMNRKTQILLTITAAAECQATEGELVPLSVEVDGWTLSMVADAGGNDAHHRDARR